MSSRTVVYGNIFSERDRHEIERNHAGQSGRLSWLNDPTVPGREEDVSLVMVDLDDSRFSDGEFLMSVATASENVQVIGKLTNPSLDETRRVSKFGVAEVLTQDQCLQRLHTFLEELEGTADTGDDKGSKYDVETLVGSSARIEEIRQTIRLLSDVDFPSALILGETGTGKSLICKILHHSGTRSKHNLVEVNCSAIPDDLFETELFGHARGAFTDAKAEKIGLFEYAQNGTLFLDEVGNLSAPAQAKLLKILEDRKLRKVGDVAERDMNVRVVTATNLDLEKTIDENRFREDLYFRLNLLTIEIPPLRERPQDIPPMLRHFLALYSTLYGKPDIQIDKAAEDDMLGYSWPGNIRELSNVIERAVLLARSKRIGRRDIKTALKKSRISAAERRQIVLEVPSQGLTLEEIEQSAVKQVLNMCKWNKSEAAKSLNISRPRLRRIIAAAGLEHNRRKG